MYMFSWEFIFRGSRVSVSKYVWYSWAQISGRSEDSELESHSIDDKIFHRLSSGRVSLRSSLKNSVNPVWCFLAQKRFSLGMRGIWMPKHLELSCLPQRSRVKSLEGCSDTLCFWGARQVGHYLKMVGLLWFPCLSWVWMQEFLILEPVQGFSSTQVLPGSFKAWWSGGEREVLCNQQIPGLTWGW